MMHIESITNARLRDRKGLANIAIGNDGRIAAITNAAVGGRRPAARQRRGSAIDAAGGVVLPSLFDNHLHLDLAHSVDLVPENRSGTLLEAIGLWAKAKANMPPASVCERAVRAIEEEISSGTGYIRITSMSAQRPGCACARASWRRARRPPAASTSGW